MQLIKLNAVIAVCFSLLQVCAQEPGMDWVNQTGATVHIDTTRVFLANDYGAVADTGIVCTVGIQAAIDACAAKGGGMVRLRPGIYVTGSLFIKSNVRLQLDEGVQLWGSQRFSDYPEIDTRIAGIEMKWPAALLNVIGQHNVVISGKGVVNGRGKFCWDKYWAMRKEYDVKGLRWIVDYDAKRVRSCLIQSSEHVRLEGITFKNSGFWTVQLLYSAHLTVNGVTIRNNEDGHGPSTDGIDIDSSSWALVENCDIDCNDDDFCLKAGRDWDGLRVNRPTEYVVIRHCVARKGGGLLTLGSETSGGIRHVLATDLVASGTGNGFHMKSATVRGGTVEDIHLRNIQMDSVGNVFYFTMNWYPAYSYAALPDGYTMETLPEHWKKILHKVEPPEKGIPHFRNIEVEGIVVRYAYKAFSAEGLPTSPLENFRFRNIRISAATAGEAVCTHNWTLEQVKVDAKDGRQPEIR